MEREGQRFQFRAPASVIIYGQSQSGKTTLMLRILESLESLISPMPERIFWARGAKTDMVVPEYVSLIEGLPSIDDIPPNSLLILDDFGPQIANDKKAAKALEVLSMIQCHHKRITTFLLLQSVFGNNRKSRINATEMIFVRTLADSLELSNISRQLFPKEPSLLLEAQKLASRIGERYILVSTHPANEQIKVLTRIFPSEDSIFFEPS